MFTNLTQFGFVRTRKQAFGFYLAWLLVTIIVAGLAGVLIGSFTATPGGTFAQGYREGAPVGATAGVIICTIFVISILNAKKMFSHFSSILFIVGTIALSLVGGGILGLIIPAYLTTRPATKTEIVP